MIVPHSKSLIICFQLKNEEAKVKLRDLLVVPFQRILKYHLLIQVSAAFSHGKTPICFKDETGGVFHSFIHSGHLYSTSSVRYYSEVLPTLPMHGYCAGEALPTHHRYAKAPQANASEGLA